MKEKIFVVLGLEIRICIDSEGYVSLETDGYKPATSIQQVLSILKSHQTKDDVEYQKAVNRHFR